MRIVWVSFAPLEKTSRGLTSRVASVRYRITIPAAAMAAGGVESRVTYVGPGTNRRTLLERFDGAHAAVLGKPLTPPAELESMGRRILELVGELRSRGVRVLADYSDDNFADPACGPLYRAIATAVDGVIASTPKLADVLRQETSAPIDVVTDPVEGERQAARVGSDERLRLLWFGHPANLDTLEPGLAQIEARDIDYALTLVTAPGAAAETPAYRFRPWSTAAVFEELQNCDAVIIPSNPHDPRKAVKSPNRFTESLWAGRFVIAHPLPAYEPLAGYGWVGEDLGEGLAWLRAHRAQASERIRAGQEWVATHCSREAVALAWKSAITAS